MRVIEARMFEILLLGWLMPDTWVWTRLTWICIKKRMYLNSDFDNALRQLQMDSIVSLETALRSNVVYSSISCKFNPMFMHPDQGVIREWTPGRYPLDSRQYNPTRSLIGFKRQIPKEFYSYSSYYRWTLVFLCELPCLECRIIIAQ